MEKTNVSHPTLSTLLIYISISAAIIVHWNLGNRLPLSKAAFAVISGEGFR